MACLAEETEEAKALRQEHAYLAFSRNSKKERKCEVRAEWVWAHRVGDKFREKKERQADDIGC